MGLRALEEGGSVHEELGYVQLPISFAVPNRAPITPDSAVILDLCVRKQVNISPPANTLFTQSPEPDRYEGDIPTIIDAEASRICSGPDLARFALRLCD